MHLRGSRRPCGASTRDVFNRTTFLAHTIPRASFATTVPRAAFLRYRKFSTLDRRRATDRFHRSDLQGQGFTGVYEPHEPTYGPLGDANIVAVPRVTPKGLKKYLDQYVVGQERAKKVLSVAVYNHYQRIKEQERQETEQEALQARRARLDMAHGSPGDQRSPSYRTVEVMPNPPQTTRYPYDHSGHWHHIPPEVPRIDLETDEVQGGESTLVLEKSNVMLLGPSGTGKTLLAKTLAKRLNVPFSMSDCTPFTQAGYIGEDTELCVARLLAAADYDVARAERGIICLDEIDKIATARVSHGKDVGGEGVQQALLKIIEGTTVQIHAKGDKGNPSKGGAGIGIGSNTPGSMGSQSGIGGAQAGSKGETYNVKTDDILFICTGAFVGLQQTIMDRVGKGSIGFGADIRNTSNTDDPDSSNTHLEGHDELFRKHLPFRPAPSVDGPSSSSSPLSPPTPPNNVLDLATSSDLQRYGLIPELIGRLPITCALSSLDKASLVRVLTEPKNSLLHQYEHLLSLSGIELRFTSAAIQEVATLALKMSTGARALRTVMEQLLSDCMFECPGSATKYILITAAVAKGEEAPICMARGQKAAFHELIAAEEDAWEAKQQLKRQQEQQRQKKMKEEKKTDGDGRGPGKGPPSSPGPPENGPTVFRSFEEYRQKAQQAGFA